MFDILKSLDNSVIATIVTIVLALAAAVLIFVLVFPKVRAGSKNGFLNLVSDYFEMRYLLIEKILKAAFIFFSFASIVYGIIGLFSDVILGLVVMFLGPVILRVVYELLMLFVSLVRNVSEINAKMDGSAAPEQAAPRKAPAAPVIPGSPRYRSGADSGSDSQA